MKSFLTGIAAGAVVASTITAAYANEFKPALETLATEEIQALMNDAQIIAAIQAQNEVNGGMDEASIIELDKKWRAEVGTGATPTIDPVLNGTVAEMLRSIRDESGGLFTEIFVMDSVGLNVAASDTTSDYWQGDEAKWKQTYGAGAGAVHISDIELDESTQTYQSQVSVAITDASGQPVGAATFGVNVEFLQ